MNEKVTRICETAMMMALVFVVTRFIQVPIPLGYFNVGNCVILLFCVILPNPYGVIGASVGSAFADLTSYPIYTVPTLLIKALMPILFYVIADRFHNKKKGYSIACAAATLIPLFGYTLTGGLIYGSIYTGLAQFPGLFLEYVANLVIFCVLLSPVMELKKRYGRKAVA
ncbi:MAG: ECF transporter S component [Lachnospiraceae bacterium]|nr:ECF transporter S component [Lachnospiraceae bacterium]